MKTAFIWLGEAFEGTEMLWEFTAEKSCEVNRIKVSPTDILSQKSTKNIFNFLLWRIIEIGSWTDFANENLRQFGNYENFKNRIYLW